jgi:hypothetical protein
MDPADCPPAEPVLLAGKIQGVRAWNLLAAGASGARFLRSLMAPSYWPPSRPLTAHCPEHAAPDHQPPHKDCDCGIYAWHPSRASEAVGILEAALFQDEEAPDAVAGVIEAWGRIEVHSDGFRAQHARPVALFVDPGSPPAHRCLIERLAESYGHERRPGR